jgi:hypothetical protein
MVWFKGRWRARTPGFHDNAAHARVFEKYLVATACYLGVGGRGCGERRLLGAAVAGAGFCHPRHGGGGAACGSGRYQCGRPCLGGCGCRDGRALRPQCLGHVAGRQSVYLGGRSGFQQPTGCGADCGRRQTGQALCGGGTGGRWLGAEISAAPARRARKGWWCTSPGFAGRCGDGAGAAGARECKKQPLACASSQRVMQPKPLLTSPA